ncbi:MAG TPA: NADH:flavin oxidoreductase/NADH oxidase [Acidobacteriaceae bacterium]|nr:NADH:flavin oxidoreductase/NADH oxidase [Acidobacteriaceae bacterium]
MTVDHLFSPLRFGGVTLANRIVVSPMCEYSCVDGFASDWHLVHLGSRAVGGAGLVFTEATAVLPEARISPADLGLWKDEHIAPLRRITDFLHAHGAHAGIQLAHAGRKASTHVPWQGEGAVAREAGGWSEVVAPSAIPFSPSYPQPHQIDGAGMARVRQAFRAAATRADRANFDVIEIHAAHGYLLQEFLSPLSNHRGDEYGGSLEHRARLLLEVADSIREVWPRERPLFVRISATDWTEGGFDLEQSIRLASLLREHGVSLIDVSSGGNVAGAAVPAGPGYQTKFAEVIRAQARIPTGAVGMITDPAQADHVIRTGQADLVFIAREFLRDPYWPLHAAAALGEVESWPVQYLRAAPRGSVARTSVGTPHEKSR